VTLLTDPLAGCPGIETWPELRHFVEAMRKTEKYGGLLAKISKIDRDLGETEATLNYWRGFLQGVWLVHLTRTERTAVYREYISLRLER
jgi:hypothetical protein